MSRITDYLVNISLLKRSRGIDDRRTVQLQLTKQGESILMAGLDAFQIVPKEFKAKLTNKEMKIISLMENCLISKH